MKKPLVIIPSYISRKEHAFVLDKCVKTLNKTANCDVLIVDDESPHQEQANILYDHFGLTYDNVDLIRNDENSGFSYTVNRGLEIAVEGKRDAVLVNADIEFREIGWLDEMASTDASIVGALLFYENMLIQHAGIYFSAFSRQFDHRFKGCAPDYELAHKGIECPVTGALQYIRYDCLAEVGIYDEDFKMGYEDVDYTIRAINAGHKSFYNPKVKAVHHESLFRGFHSASEKVIDWQKDSYMTILKKYQDFNFAELVPSEVK